MVITWFGLSSFKISSGTLTLITDPFSSSVGLMAPRGQADIAVISGKNNPAYNNRESLTGDGLFVIDGPGEYDAKGLFVQGIADKSATLYAIRMEGIRLGFLGCLKAKELSDQQLEALGEVDILFMPVGGKTVCDAEEATSIVRQIEPAIVIPMHYAQEGLKVTLDALGPFLKEIGSKDEPQEKLTIKKSELGAQTGTKVVVLAPTR